MISWIITGILLVSGGSQVATRANIPNLQPNLGDSSESSEEACTCVPYYLCANGSVNTNGNGIIDIRSNDGSCKNYLEVMCHRGAVTTQPITPPPKVLKDLTGCGFRQENGVGFRITGDKENEAQFAEFPWMVAVLKEDAVEGNSAKIMYQCGGALIHPQAVITAAHCVAGNNRFRIRAGEWDTQHTKEMFPYQDREVESISIHSQYYAGPLYNDIAILFLKSPVTIAENVGVICLPPQNSITVSGRCISTGWGKHRFGKEGKYQVILKKIDLPVVTNDQCQSDLRQTRLGKFFDLHNSFMCAGGELGKDTCTGDGGSPLVCQIGGNGERYYQAGIVSWGIGCGENNTPGVYVNVAAFRDWIDQQMRSKNLNTSSYQY